MTYENKKVVEIFDYFVERSAKISLVNTYGHTALHTVAAKSNDNLDLVKRIFDLCKLCQKLPWARRLINTGLFG